MVEHDDVWEPLTPREVARIMAPARFPWWIAGGHAIDHAVGRQVRPHDDIDVLLLRTDHLAARRLLADWECWAADPPGHLRRWALQERLPECVSDVWCRWREGEPWRLQLMLDDGDASMWRSRRSAAVAKPITEIGVRDADGSMFLCPEVQLFYKAKAPRAKDMLDFAAALPRLTPVQADWLKRAIAVAYGKTLDWTTTTERMAEFELLDGHSSGT